MAHARWHTTGVVLAAGVLIAAASADVRTPATDDDAALAGPKVQQRASETDTIIRRDASGKIVRHDRDPALEALELLKLSGPAAARAEAVVVKRYAALDRFVQDNLLLIAELGQANQSGDKASTRRLIAQVYQRARPFFARGSIADELKPVLDDADHQRLVRLVQEYRDACIAERMQGVNDEGRKYSTLEASMTEQLLVLGLEVRRSFERSVEQGGREFDALIKRLQLSPEQEGKIRQRVQDVYLGAQGKPTRLQVARAFLQSYQELDQTQRAELIKAISEQNRTGKPSAPATRPARRPTPPAPSPS